MPDYRKKNVKRVTRRSKSRVKDIEMKKKHREKNETPEGEGS